MSELKHTPGPWCAIPSPNYQGGKWRIDKDENVSWASFGEIAYADRANAHLVAAAPELLEALKRHCQKCYVRKRSESGIFAGNSCGECKTHKAIAKATGKEA